MLGDAMPEIPSMPRAALVGLDAAARKKARTWWARLAPSARLDFLARWDERSDDTSLYGEVQTDGSVAWRELPLEVRGLIVEGRTDGRPSRWNAELYDYLVAHPEAVVVLAGKAFHVCRAHPAAHEVLRQGHLPADFVCPLAEERCPLRRLADAAGGKDVCFGVPCR